MAAPRHSHPHSYLLLLPPSAFCLSTACPNPPRSSTGEVWSVCSSSTTSNGQPQAQVRFSLSSWQSGLAVTALHHALTTCSTSPCCSICSSRISTITPVSTLAPNFGWTVLCWHQLLLPPPACWCMQAAVGQGMKVQWQLRAQTVPGLLLGPAEVRWQCWPCWHMCTPTQPVIECVQPCPQARRLAAC
jgi:hypothetical protein